MEAQLVPMLVLELKMAVQPLQLFWKKVRIKKGANTAKTLHFHVILRQQQMELFCTAGADQYTKPPRSITPATISRPITWRAVYE
jgi:hypothetical protein